MKLLIAIIISFIFLSKSIFAVTWDEARDTTLQFLKTVTELSALLHVCEEYDLSIKAFREPIFSSIVSLFILIAIK